MIDDPEVPCSTCFGAGFTWNDAFEWDGGGHDTDEQWCEECGGTGNAKCYFCRKPAEAYLCEEDKTPVCKKCLANIEREAAEDEAKLAAVSSSP